MVSCPTEFRRGVTPSTVWSQLTLITGNSVIHHHVVPYNSVSCWKEDDICKNILIDIIISLILLLSLLLILLLILQLIPLLILQLIPLLILVFILLLNLSFILLQILLLKSPKPYDWILCYFINCLYKGPRFCPLEYRKDVYRVIFVCIMTCILIRVCEKQVWMQKMYRNYNNFLKKCENSMFYHVFFSGIFN